MEKLGTKTIASLLSGFSNNRRLATCQTMTYLCFSMQGSLMQVRHKSANVVRFDRNRRSAARYKLQLPVIFHWNEDGEHTGGGFTSDVALDGALINSSMCPPVGSDVRVEVLILSPVWGGVEMRIECVGKVTRVLEQGDVMSFGVRGDFDDDHLTPSFRETS